jgi:hypothetical protein
MKNTQFLCRERLTSQGMAERSDATVAPNPNKTSNDGNAQHKSVLSDPNKER